MVIGVHKIVITMEVERHEGDCTPTEWYWPAIISDSNTLTVRKAKIIEVMKARMDDPMMD